MTEAAVSTATGARDLTRAEAEDCLSHLRDTASATWQWVTKAYLGRAWLALGYDSWDGMCDGELGGMRLRLPREERREIVGSLREQGMSTRAIGTALGVNNATVARDLSPVANATPVVGTDGKTYTPPRVDRATGVIEDDEDVVDAEIVDDESDAGPATTSSPRRQPLPDQARDAGWDLRKSVERLERIADDDRFGSHKEQVTTHLRSHLSYAIEVCQDLLNRLAQGA